MNPDPNESLGIYDLLAWFEINRKLIIGGIATLALVAFGIYAYIYQARQREIQATDALLSMKSESAPDTALDPTAYLKFSQQYSGTGAGERARVLAATAWFDQGKYVEAQQEFQRFLKDQPNSLIAPTAAYGVATALEAQGQRDAALTEYQNITVRYPNSAVVDDAKLGMARIYQAKGQPQQALRIYDELNRPGAFSTAGMLVPALRKQLLTEHPELEAKTASGSRTNIVTIAPTNRTPALARSNSPAASLRSAASNSPAAARP